jgi:MurNAc alpha-1-phosphate uridylyltransferase
MRAMILAAGRGERLKPLTDTLPKPLIEVGGKALIEYHIERLAAAGFGDIVINQGHLGDMLPERLGNGEKWRVRIHWSVEPPDALETGGGIFQALPLLGSGPFLVINGDIYADYPVSRMRAVKCDYAHLVLVPNPGHNPKGDFALEGARIRNPGQHSDELPCHTFSGMAVYHPRLFAECAPGRYSIVPTLRKAVDEQLVTGELYRGQWMDIGNLERLQALRQELESRSGKNRA